MNSKHSSSSVFSKEENFSVWMDYPTQMSPGDNPWNKSRGFEDNQSVTNRNRFKPEGINAHTSRTVRVFRNWNGEYQHILHKNYWSDIL